MSRRLLMGSFLLMTILFLSCSTRVNYNLSGNSYKRVYTGLENFTANGIKRYKGKRAVLVTNHSGVDFYLHKNIDLLRNKGIEIAFILAPEHGVYGYENDYDKLMYHADDQLNAVIYNLHHLNALTLKHLLSIAGVVIFDIQDMGLRCYTYISSLKLIMDALQGTGIDLVVLDRPNPLGFLGVDGPYLEKEFFSRHISAFPSTFMYDMTIGEAARYYKGEFLKDIKLRVIPLVNYHKDMLYNETMLPWVPPSPNLPTYESSIVYSAIVMLEGINISVGRGTPKPFEYIGASWIDPVPFCDALNNLQLKNFKFRPIYFAPTFSKYKGERCGGVQIFYVGGMFSPMEVSYRLIKYIKGAYPECKWARYKGMYDIDYLNGTDAFRRAIDEGADYSQFYNSVKKKIRQFEKKRSKYLIY